MTIFKIYILSMFYRRTLCISPFVFTSSLPLILYSHFPHLSPLSLSPENVSISSSHCPLVLLSAKQLFFHYCCLPSLIPGHIHFSHPPPAYSIRGNQKKRKENVICILDHVCDVSRKQKGSSIVRGRVARVIVWKLVKFIGHKGMLRGIQPHSCVSCHEGNLTFRNIKLLPCTVIHFKSM